MLDGIGSRLKLEIVKFLLQHFSMSQDVARVWPAPSQHLTPRSNNVARCCVEMLSAFGRAFSLNCASPTLIKVFLSSIYEIIIT